MNTVFFLVGVLPLELLMFDRNVSPQYIQLFLRKDVDFGIEYVYIR